MANFSTISSEYKEKSLVQASASKQLITLLSIPANADVLDVGCGTGNLTAELRTITSGRVVGIDQSEGMIEQAQNHYKDKAIEFYVLNDDQLSFSNEFDVIFCNSTFQWFKTPSVTLSKFKKALRASGKVGIQAPAKKEYCPNFIKAIEHCSKSDEVAALFSGFESPWFFLESAEEYGKLFENAGFEVISCRLDEVHQAYSPEKALDVFSSGAAAGYLNQQYFSKSLPNDFSER
ncbi:MAG: methyltransferase domain-containing protein, partial [Chlorobiales bacterium]|nr:methyltransferase domain-containing protein [Chlorobiales bacterium]